MEDLLRVTDGETDMKLAQMTLEQSKDLWDWLNEQGVLFQPSMGGTLTLSRTNAFFLGGGKAMLNALYRTALSLGVTVEYDTEVIDVDIVDGFAKTVTVQKGEDTETISIRAFIAASGGFEANIDWLKEAWGPSAENFLIRGTPYNKGRVLRIMMDRGVQILGDPKQCHAVAIDGRAPKFDGGLITRLDCVPFGVVVNANGERFYDEGEDFWPKRYAICECG